VDILDLVMVGRSFGKTGKNLVTDVNGDGVVDLFDLVMVAGFFGGAIATPSIHDIDLLQQIYDILKAAPDHTPNLELALIELEKLLVPVKTTLLPNYPNPFNPETWIPFQLAEPANVVNSIYDTRGQLIREIGLGQIPAGVYADKNKAVYWNGRNEEGEEVSSGIYFYHLNAGDYRATKKMLALR
jgi:hypothetical protein